MQMALILSISWHWLASLSVPGIVQTPSYALFLLIFIPTYKVGSAIKLLLQMDKLRLREFRPPAQDDVCVVQSLSCVWLCNPMDCSTPGLPVLFHLPEFAQTYVHWVSDDQGDKSFAYTTQVAKTSRGFLLRGRNSHKHKQQNLSFIIVHWIWTLLHRLFYINIYILGTYLLSHTFHKILTTW